VHFDDLEIDKHQLRQDVTLLGKDFISTPQMIRQIREFAPLVKMLTADGCDVTVYGNGAVPWIAMLHGWHVMNKRTREIQEREKLAQCALDSADWTEAMRQLDYLHGCGYRPPTQEKA
jgi:hypothetical protein